MLRTHWFCCNCAKVSEGRRCAGTKKPCPRGGPILDGWQNYVGHTSHTGSEQFNDSLSLSRATYITQRLQLQVSQLHGRLESEGRGFRENIVGSGTDDVRDALDRRVEFTVRDCH